MDSRNLDVPWLLMIQPGGPLDNCDVAYTKSGKVRVSIWPIYQSYIKNHSFLQIARRDINHLLTNNKEWIKSKTAYDPQFFQQARPKHH
jgi:hypothetical protein